MWNISMYKGIYEPQKINNLWEGGNFLSVKENEI